MGGRSTGLYQTSIWNYFSSLGLKKTFAFSNPIPRTEVKSTGQQLKNQPLDKSLLLSSPFGIIPRIGQGFLNDFYFLPGFPRKGISLKVCFPNFWRIYFFSLSFYPSLIFQAIPGGTFLKNFYFFPLFPQLILPGELVPFSLLPILLPFFLSQRKGICTFLYFLSTILHSFSSLSAPKFRSVFFFSQVSFIQVIFSPPRSLL